MMFGTKKALEISLAGADQKQTVRLSPPFRRALGQRH
jgi:hypothetical protein